MTPRALWRSSGDVHDQMMEELAGGDYTPENATLFVNGVYPPGNRGADVLKGVYS